MTKKSKENFFGDMTFGEALETSLKQAVDITSNKKYYDQLIESKKQIEQGKVVIKTMEELEDMAKDD